LAKAIAIAMRHCIGCSMCALTCSIYWADEFNLEKGYVRVKRYDREGRFEVTFSSACRQCLRCAENCPSGALRVVEVPDSETKKGDKAGDKKAEAKSKLA